MIRLSLIALMLLLSACQTRLPVGPLPDSVDNLQNWNLSGRLGYRAGNDGGSASIDWRQRHPEGEIHFSGPVGIGSARLFWAPGSAELDTGKEQLSAANSAELAWRLTGLWLPVEALQFWVRGLPWPDAVWEEQRNDLGQLTELQQLGWSLTFSDYLSSGALTLPQRIRASHDNQRFTLVIRKWEPLP
ncbi:MAG: outer membrane lipoprotein LolB [Alcanivoracaceae bacterium]|jgi:outer membrane lipoprotein LolB|nr:outer membrane lipoprotein LolB [Alcanivoracaceae bacterium]